MGFDPQNPFLEYAPALRTFINDITQKIGFLNPPQRSQSSHTKLFFCIEVSHTVTDPTPLLKIGRHL